MNQFNDDQYDRVCDENEKLLKEVFEAREAARWLFLMAEDHPSLTAQSRWPWLKCEDPS